MSFAVPRALPLVYWPLWCWWDVPKPAQPRSKGEKARGCGKRCAPKNARQREGPGRMGADLAKTFESQKIAPTEENICSVLAVARQESKLQSDQPCRA